MKNGALLWNKKKIYFECTGVTPVNKYAVTLRIPYYYHDANDLTPEIPMTEMLHAIQRQLVKEGLPPLGQTDTQYSWKTHDGIIEYTITTDSPDIYKRYLQWDEEIQYRRLDRNIWGN
jgi:hypothetical protein